MVYKKTMKSMSIKRINMLLGDIDSDYHLEKEDNTGEIVMVKNEDK